MRIPGRKQKTDWLIGAAVMWRGWNPAGPDHNTLSYATFSSLNSHSSKPANTSRDEQKPTHWNLLTYQTTSLHHPQS